VIRSVMIVALIASALGKTRERALVRRR